MDLCCTTKEGNCLTKSVSATRGSVSGFYDLTLGLLKGMGMSLEAVILLGFLN